MSKNKIALITGGTSGIGYEIAILHASRGGDLVLASRNFDKLKNIKKEITNSFNVNVTIIKVDLSEPDSAMKLYYKVKKSQIEIDFLINNAGFGGYGLFNERDHKEDIEMIQLNIISLTTLMYLFLGDFIKKNDGKILNVSSSASLMPGPLQAVYFATKAFVKSLSNAVSKEVSNTNVTITNLMPAPTKTGFVSKANVLGSKMFDNLANPKKVAKDGYQAMLKGKLNVLSGFSFWGRIKIKMIPIVPLNIILDTIYNSHKK
jgi:uncharacterized protein